MFHVSQLEPVTPNPFPNRTQAPPPPIIIDGEEEYYIAEVLDSMIDKRYKHSSPLRYLVRWAGYEGTPLEFTWEPANNIHADELIPAFHARYPNKPGPLPI